MHDIRRTELPSRDARQRIRITKGRMPKGDLARFQIADRETSDAEARRRLDVIHSLYEKQCKRSQLNHWTIWAHAVATELGKGNRITFSFLETLLSPAAASSTIVLLQDWGIPVHVDQPNEFNLGISVHREQIETMVSTLVQQQLHDLKQARGPIVDQIKLPNAMQMTESATLFEAFDAFVKHLERTGERGETGNLKTKVYNNIREIERLKLSFSGYKNLPLWQLDLKRWEDLVRIWRHRPVRSDGQRATKGGAEGLIKRLYRFGRWLHSSPDFDWQKPDGFDDADRTVMDLAADDNGQAFQTITKETFTPDELATIMDHCTPLQRAMIATCVNCAFGQSEIGQWKARRVQLFVRHPHEKAIDYPSSDNDSWIVGPRPKTKLYGEHLLWPEVATSLSEVIKSGQEFIWETRTGNPVFKAYSKQPASEINNWWNKTLMPRVIEANRNFRSLPFGSLRDVLPNILARDYSHDVATLALQHKTFTEDELLKCYANLPFKKLFNATKELHAHFLPMLKKLGKQSKA
jgi:hypothetical protein